MNKIVRLELNEAQFAVIYEFVRNIRLGDRNEYENTISDLAISMEEHGAEDYLNKYYDETGASRPTFRVECSEEEGLVFNVE
jgi:hypothetical protein